MASDYGTLGGVSALGAVDARSRTFLVDRCPTLGTDPCAASLAGALQHRPRRRHNLHVCSTVGVPVASFSLHAVLIRMSSPILSDTTGK